MRAIFDRTGRKTVLLITHRLIDLERMDRIVMLDTGRIVADGSHRSLLATCPAYGSLRSGPDPSSV